MTFKIIKVASIGLIFDKSKALLEFAHTSLLVVQCLSTDATIDPQKERSLGSSPRHPRSNPPLPLLAQSEEEDRSYLV